ncbi:thioesterase family protein [Silvibacterium dinghuense]|uniref:Thioesterase n=1 Tax=Silvibacterium dinghuense TaxID=1560006 RepID=A0A4Q1S740_9BACT|nr:hotdog domain-containing protein [Silvibacterium dinghuense]RXS92791.1 thioesterase [Silvibacterium dinghuense]GGH17587.1 hypothetical protein GCM10011586_40170 [Silvibacterium dinghuense]
MQAIPVGVKGYATLVVEPKHLANEFKDPSLPHVLATPILILLMENAALDAVRSYLDPGESAVGTAVEIKHHAPTPVGQRVIAEAEVIRIDKRRIIFLVTACDETEEIGVGVHERTVVDISRLAQRLAAKSNLRSGKM